MLRNLAVSLILFESIATTKPKAKEAKVFVERLIARSKDNTLATRRNVLAAIGDRVAVKKVMDEFIPRYEGRKSGFVRIIQLKNRLGDNAEMARVELVDKKVFVDTESRSESVGKTKPKKADKAVETKAASEVATKITENKSQKTKIKEEKDEKSK